MARECCTGERPTRRVAPRAAAGLLPAAALAFLPKCPFCVAAWLTLVTGISIPVAAAARLRELAVVLSIAFAAFAAVRLIRLKASGVGE